MMTIIFLSIIFLLLDQISKVLVIRLMNVNHSIELIKNFFYLTYTHNTGAAFSILTGKRIFLILIAIVLLIVIFNYLREFHHLNCSFDYFFLPSEYVSRYLTSIFHNNPYCTLLKRTKLAKCNLAKRVIIRRNKQEIYYAKFI